jgi:hypothetical protein
MCDRARGAVFEVAHPRDSGYHKRAALEFLGSGATVVRPPAGNGSSFTKGEGMEKPKKTSKGFLIGRRCDECGTRVQITADRGDSCILKCFQCGKEYKFSMKPR